MTSIERLTTPARGSFADPPHYGSKGSLRNRALHARIYETADIAPQMAHYWNMHQA